MSKSRKDRKELKTKFCQSLLLFESLVESKSCLSMFLWSMKSVDKFVDHFVVRGKHCWFGQLWVDHNCHDYFLVVEQFVERSHRLFDRHLVDLLVGKLNNQTDLKDRSKRSASFVEENRSESDVDDVVFVYLIICCFQWQRAICLFCCRWCKLISGRREKFWHWTGKNNVSLSLHWTAIAAEFSKGNIRKP